MIQVTKEELRVLTEMALTHQQQLIGTLIAALRPFAKVADAQKHTDCGGGLTQGDWEAAAQLVAGYDEAGAIVAMHEKGGQRAH